MSSDSETVDLEIDFNTYLYDRYIVIHRDTHIELHEKEYKKHIINMMCLIIMMSCFVMTIFILASYNII